MSKKRWYETYDERALMAAGFLFLIPLGAGLRYLEFATLLGIPFLVMGVASASLGLYLWLKKVLARQVRVRCPHCSRDQKVSKTSTAYYCDFCGQMVQIKDAQKLGEDETEAVDIRLWAPYARVTLSYQEALKLEDAGRIDEAIDIHLANIRENSSLGLTHYEKAASLLEEQGRYAEAIEVCTKALQPGAIRFDESLRGRGKEYAQKEFGTRLTRLRRALEKEEGGSL